MKIRKTAPLHIAIAMILSAAFLLAGCGSNTPKETAPDIFEEETSNNESSVPENDREPEHTSNAENSLSPRG